MQQVRQTDFTFEYHSVVILSVKFDYTKVTRCNRNNRKLQFARYLSVIDKQPRGFMKFYVSVETLEVMRPEKKSRPEGGFFQF